jgi:hypothetical protein
LRYTDFKEVICAELEHHPEGLTWMELKVRLALSYERPCPTWVQRLEEETGLVRTRNPGRPATWTIPPKR